MATMRSVLTEKNDMAAPYKIKVYKENEKLEQFASPRPDTRAILFLKIYRVYLSRSNRKLKCANLWVVSMCSTAPGNCPFLLSKNRVYDDKKVRGRYFFQYELKADRMLTDLEEIIKIYDEAKGRILLYVEGAVSPQQFKALRKLILNELGVSGAEGRLRELLQGKGQADNARKGG